MDKMRFADEKQKADSKELGKSFTVLDEDMIKWH